MDKETRALLDEENKALLGEVLNVLCLIPYYEILHLANMGKDLRGYKDAAATARTWVLSVEAAKKRVKIKRKLALACKE